MPACNADFICIVCLELDQCSNTFSEGACTATGTPCRNTWETCTDRCNFECTTNEVYLSSCPPPPHYPINAFPIVNANSISRTVVKPQPGRSFSTRPFVTMSLNDVLDNDQELNPYADPSLIKPDDAPGTFLGRLLNGQRWFDGRVATMYTGYCSQSFESLTRERFVIQSLAGNPHETRGTASLQLQDTLLLANDATCPRTSEYIHSSPLAGAEFLSTLTLAIELSEDDPFLVLGQFLLNTNLFAGDAEQNAFIASVEYVLIGSEVLGVEACINDAGAPGWNFKLVSRAQCDSELSQHRPGSSLFPGMSYNSVHIVDIIRSLLTDCAELRDALINCCVDQVEAVIDPVTFEEYRCNNPLQFGPRRKVIFKPESVRDIINELEILFNFELYTDQACGLVKIRDNRPCPRPFDVLDECRILSINIAQSESYQRLSVLHSPLDCSQQVDEDNAQTADVFTTEDSIRKPCERRESRTIKNRTIETSWIDASNRHVLLTGGYRFIRRFRRGLRFLTIKGGPDLINDYSQELGIRINHQSIQTPHGFRDTETVFKVTALIPGKDESTICAVEQVYSNDVDDCIDCVTIQPRIDICEPCTELY